MMNVFITGGAGFIGSELARRLASLGNQVTLIDNLSEQVHGPNAGFPADLPGIAKCVRGDVCDRDLLAVLLENTDAVVHLAAETGTGQSMYAIERYERVNVHGTATLLDIVVNDRPRRLRKILVASSRAIYGEGQYRCGVHGVIYPRARSTDALSAGRFEPECPRCGSVLEPMPTEEDAPMAPSSFYGITKQVQEQMVTLFGATLGLDALALRYQNVYGPGQSLKNPYTGLIAVFSNLVRRGKPLSVFEDGLESRDFVYIDDVVAATTSCLDPSIVGVHVLNVGSGVRTTVLEVAHAVRRYFKSSVPVETTGEFRSGDIRHNAADIGRLRRLTGFEPRVTFDEGIVRFLDWAQLHEAADVGFERSLLELKERGLFAGNS